MKPAAKGKEQRAKSRGHVLGALNILLKEKAMDPEHIDIPVRNVSESQVPSLILRLSLILSESIIDDNSQIQIASLAWCPDR